MNLLMWLGGNDGWFPPGDIKCFTGDGVYLHDCMYIQTVCPCVCYLGILLAHWRTHTYTPSLTVPFFLSLSMALLMKANSRQRATLLL